MNENNNYAGRQVQKLDEKGEVVEKYESAKEAAGKNAVSYRYLINCLNKGQKCHGVKYEYFKTAFVMPIKKHSAAGFQTGHNPYETYRERKGGSG